MATGAAGHHGVTAVCHVTLEHTPERGYVTTLPPKMAERTVLETAKMLRSAC